MSNPYEDDLSAQAEDNDSSYKDRLEQIKRNDLTDQRLGIERYIAAAERAGFMFNLQPGEMVDDQTKTVISVVDFYFLEDLNKRFKVSLPFRPYFFLGTTPGTELQVSNVLTKKYGSFMEIEVVEKEDLDLKNHLSGLKAKYVKLSFPSMREFAKVKSDLMPTIRKNKERIKQSSAFTTLLARHIGGAQFDAAEGDVLNEIVDIREYDVPYHMRVAIDLKLFVGKWYTTRGLGPNRVPTIVEYEGERLPKMPVVLAFDIETTKLPLKFPDSSFDEIMMISYMINGRGYLIINRDIVSADIDEFEYTPKPEYKGNFKVYNEKDEAALIRRFFDHVLQVRPSIIVTYNGDFFDWPFVETRAKVHGMDMEAEIGFAKDNQEEYKSRNCCHMDAYRWVKRDSYLPVGSQNLKAVCKAKLRYDPVELDPELMCKMAREDPHVLATYSVSDAVATYYLYQKYVHPFIFALCTIIPLGPDDVLRKGSGTLCEALLMVEAFHGKIIFPNKHISTDEMGITRDGHRIESETYVGGHVEALEAGAFRADIPVRFRMVPTALMQLREECAATLAMEIKREYGIERDQLTDFDEVIENEVKVMFDKLLEHPARAENPRIYHLDVGAMYPNIILTNRLQPCAMVDEETCMGCVYNTPDATCKRTMPWMWRGELIPATRGEYQQIVQQLEGETFGKPAKPFHQLDKKTRLQIEKKRVQDYSKRVYGRTHLTRVEKRHTTICQRENDFYVNTVLAFRDRRYDYKELLKKAKGQLTEAEKNGDVNGIKTGKALCVLYESLQLAHKCILNSFYGYVMRKGSRWFSMEMAGIVCHTGANIITEARKLVEQIGKPLELDTDGIWCLLPSSFPEDFTFKVTGWKKDKVAISYPAAMLNALVHEGFTNEQYHKLEADGSYTTSEENTIYFEVDGPYLCMLLPASKEEGKKLKKRYAVFNFDGSMAELKGFELKRRGELNIIKYFQDGVFRSFLNGHDLQSLYESVAKDADKWLDILFTKGEDLEEHQLFDLIAENRSMSRKLEDYGGQKSTSISTAKRLAEFLGADMVKDAGLACQFIISKFPHGAPVTERAIPLAIFQAEPAVKSYYMRKWTKNHDITAETNVRDILDWEYYIERMGSCIQKIITIPAALQGVANPVPRISHPDWLDNKIRNKMDAHLQPKITDMFQRVTKEAASSSQSQSSSGFSNGKRNRTASTGEEVVEIDKENQDPKRTKGIDNSHCSSTEAPLEKKTQAEHGLDEWIRFLKAKWRKGRRERRREHNSTAVERMVQVTRDRTRARTWQVLSVEETREPGVFNLWATVDGQMNKYGVRVERCLLVNQEQPREKGETVRRILPHRKQSLYLYEHNINEEKFETLMSSVNSQLCTAEMEGIYESQTPLSFNLLATLGCVCRVVGPSEHSMWPLSSLKMVPSSAPTDYLPDGSIRSIFVYKYSQDDRSFWAIFDPSTSEAHVFVLHTGVAQIPSMEKTYDALYKENLEQPGNSQMLAGVREKMKFHVHKFLYFEKADAYKEIGKVVGAIRRATTRPTMLVVLADESRNTLVARVPAMGLFPHVKLLVREPSTLFSTLEWQKVVARRSIQHFFNSYSTLYEYVQWSRYLHIPLGNITVDPVQFGLDLFFARSLREAGYALWASPSSRPDLGGKELDDIRLSVDWKPLTEDQDVLINKPSFCGTVCVELELGAIAVSAIVHRSRLLEAEGADDTVALESVAPLPSNSIHGLKNTISAYDEGAAVDGAVRILKAMLQGCIQEIAHHGNVWADHMVAGLHRWLHSPAALLYDPAIARSVSVLERKLCLLLSTEIDRLGANVIHASPTKILLNTGKKTVSQASVFTTSLLSTLSKHPLFSSVHISVVNTYSTLLWKDQFNYSGILVEEPSKEVGDGECEVVVERPAASAPNHVSRWRLCDALPQEEMIQKEFHRIAIGYCLLWRNEFETMETTTTEATTAARSNILLNAMASRIFRVVSALTQGKVEEHSKAAASFVSAVCQVLSLDEECEDAVESLSEQLNRMLDNRPPKLEATSLFIPAIFCESCSLSNDVDLCDESAWVCPGCQKPFDRVQIDGMLCERLNALLSAYLLQDHVCEKCKMVRRDTLSEYCSCSGSYGNTLKREDLLKNAKVAATVGELRGLSQTSELCQWIEGLTSCI